MLVKLTGAVVLYSLHSNKNKSQEGDYSKAQWKVNLRWDYQIN